MYVKFSLKHTQCIWNFGWHWAMYIKFWSRPLNTLFLWVGHRKMSIDLCAPYPKSMCGIWWQLNRRNNSTTALKCHFFTLRLLRATTFKRVTGRAIAQSAWSLEFEPRSLRWSKSALMCCKNGVMETVVFCNENIVQPNRGWVERSVLSCWTRDRYWSQLSISLTSG